MFKRDYFLDSIKSANRGEHALSNYLQAYLKNLHSCTRLNISEIETYHINAASSLHRYAGASEPDIAAFLYAALRLPECIDQAVKVVIAGDDSAFEAAGYPDVANWTQVQSRARRRRYHYNLNGDLAVFITSVTDLDDIIPSLCAFQIEWNKLHGLLSLSPLASLLASGKESASVCSDELRNILKLNLADWNMLEQVWGQDWDRKFAALASKSLSLLVERLPLNQNEFEDWACQWWQMVNNHFQLDSCRHRPLYFVSSNSHGIGNLVSGFALSNQNQLVDFMRTYNPDGIWDAWSEAQRDPDSNGTNFLYYAARYYFELFPEELAARTACEQRIGIERFAPNKCPCMEAQKIELRSLDSSKIDARLKVSSELMRSDALIINIEYPLGLAASYITKYALSYFPKMRGLFILGKSAACLGRLGDIMVPNEVYDSHTNTCYRFSNCIGVRQLTPYLSRIAVFDEQKSITVRGTFLHNLETAKPLLHHEFTGIEMEAGPYMSALHRHFSKKETLPNTCYDICLPSDFKLGVVHYTSDTPYNVRPSLLSKSLGLTGLEAAYSAILGITQNIFSSVK